MADEVPPVLPKPPRKYGGIPITIGIYEKIVDAYLSKNQRSIRALARATGVSNDTAAKAISLGWPERKWASLRERAELFDRQARAGKRAQPLTTEEVQTLKTFLDIKVENANTLRAVSGAAQGILAKCREAVDRATADRQGSRRRIVVDVTTTGTGKRAVRKEVHKTVVEDYVLPPYLPHVVGAMESIARIVAIANEGVRRWMVSKPGDDLDVGVRGYQLKPEEVLEYIRANGGKLPPGVTREMLGW